MGQIPQLSRAKGLSGSFATPTESRNSLKWTFKIQVAWTIYRAQEQNIDGNLQLYPGIREKLGDK